MEIVNLPQRIGKSKDEEIIFHHFKTPSKSVKGMGILHKNAISMVISGTKTMQFANSSVTINDSEFHFLSVGNCMVTMELPKNKFFESILIFFDDKILADFHLKYEAKVTAIRNRNKLTVEPYIAFKKDDFVRNFITSLKLLIHTNQAPSAEMKRLKLEEILLHLLEKYPLQLLAFPLFKSRELKDLEIKKCVEINLTKNISVEELAFLCNLSLSTFKRRFTSIYGMSPSKWMLQKRMELAKALISENGDRPSDVYHKVGYENHSSFSQSFKQYFGVSPKKYIPEN
jgi:AraC-like DNA-binding protein